MPASSTATSRSGLAARNAAIAAAGSAMASSYPRRVARRKRSTSSDRPATVASLAAITSS
jgi:hypothetical protein